MTPFVAIIFALVKTLVGGAIGTFAELTPACPRMLSPQQNPSPFMVHAQAVSSIAFVVIPTIVPATGTTAGVRPPANVPPSPRNPNASAAPPSGNTTTSPSVVSPRSCWIPG